MEGLFWPILFLMVGLGLLIAEVFLPTGGLLGLLAGGCLVGSGYLAYAASASVGFRWLLLEVMTVPLTWVGAFYGLPHTKLGRRIYLQPPTGEEVAVRAVGIGQVGHIGRVLTPLRPSGMVEVEGRRVEAMAEAGLIDSGTIVRVIAIRAGRFVVREV